MENESQEKLVDALSRIINMMRDFSFAAISKRARHQFEITQGDGLERIYQLRDSSRVR